MLHFLAANCTPEFLEKLLEQIKETRAEIQGANSTKEVEQEGVNLQKKHPELDYNINAYPELKKFCKNTCGDSDTFTQNEICSLVVSGFIEMYMIPGFSSNFNKLEILKLLNSFLNKEITDLALAERIVEICLEGDALTGQQQGVLIGNLENAYTGQMSWVDDYSIEGEVSEFKNRLLSQDSKI